MLVEPWNGVVKVGFSFRVCCSCSFTTFSQKDLTSLTNAHCYKLFVTHWQNLGCFEHFFPVLFSKFKAKFLKNSCTLFPTLIIWERVMPQKYLRHTSLESYIIQLSKNVCSFSVESFYQKLLAFSYFQNCQNRVGWMLVIWTNSLITFDWLKIQKSYRHRWKAESCSFPTMSVAFLYLQPIKS